jgi:ankyrin repeat protein
MKFSVPISDSAVRATLFNFADHMHLNGFSETAEILLHTLESIDARDEGGETILHQAAKNCSPHLIRVLLQLGANIEVRDSYGETALHIAAARGTVMAVGLLLDAGADTEAAIPVTKYTALDRAAEAGRLSIVKMLVNRGANINAELSGADTAAHLALTKKFDDIAEYLIRKMLVA